MQYRCPTLASLSNTSLPLNGYTTLKRTLIRVPYLSETMPYPWNHNHVEPSGFRLPQELLASEPVLRPTSGFSSFSLNSASILAHFTDPFRYPGSCTTPCPLRITNYLLSYFTIKWCTVRRKNFKYSIRRVQFSIPQIIPSLTITTFWEDQYVTV